MNCKVFPFMTSSSCTEPPNEKRFETYRRKDKILNWTLLYLRSTWNFPFKDECANLMSSSTLGIHGFVDLIFSIKITRIILSGNKKGLFVFTFSVIPVGAILPIKKNVTVLFSLMCSLLWEVFSAIAPLSADQVTNSSELTSVPREQTRWSCVHEAEALSHRTNVCRTSGCLQQPLLLGAAIPPPPNQLQSRTVPSGELVLAHQRCGKHGHLKKEALHRRF